jgi:hypothetical protein
MLGSIFAPAALFDSVAASPLDARENHSETVASRTEMRRYSGLTDPHAASALAVEHPTTPTAPAPRFATHDEPLPAPAPRFAAHDEPPLLPRYDGGEQPAQRRMDRAEQDEGALFGQVAESAQEEASFRSASKTVSADSSPISQPQPIRPAQALMPISLQSLRVSAGPRVDQPQRAPAQRNEPDEIHIHIGRIEVASVAPPRVAAPPPRKSLSLDDYLRRGHGGQR